MEFKKKTIIWESNSEPPKNYIWIKSDGKPYEYSYSQREWIESKSINTSSNNDNNSEGDDGSVGSDSGMILAKLTVDKVNHTVSCEESDIYEYTAGELFGLSNIPNGGVFIVPAFKEPPQSCTQIMSKEQYCRMIGLESENEHNQIS